MVRLMRHAVFAFILSLFCITLQVWIEGYRAPTDDEFRYFSLTRTLTDTGVFSNAGFDGDPTEPGQFFGPAYPFLLSGISHINSDARRFIACQADRGKTGAVTCNGSPYAIIAVQVFLGAIRALCVFLLALMIVQSPLVAWVSLSIFLSTRYTADVALHYLTENLSLLGFYLFMTAFVWAISSRKTLAFLIAGLSISLAILARPPYLYVLYFLSIALVVLSLLPSWREGERPLRMVHGVVLLAAASAGLLPWMLRNFVLFGNISLTSGYAGYALVERLTYNRMTTAEWFIAYLYWIPKWGERLTAYLFSPETYQRLSWDHPDSYYRVGGTEVRLQTIQAAGGMQNHLRYLINEMLLNTPLKHVIVSLPLSWRGIWLPRTIGLSAAGIILIVPFAFAMAHKHRLTLYLAALVPVIFMVGFHGFVSVNNARYNLPLLSIYCMVTAYALVQLGDRLPQLLRNSRAK